MQFSVSPYTLILFSNRFIKESSNNPYNSKESSVTDPDPHDRALDIFEQISLGLTFRLFHPETLVIPLFLASVNSIIILTF